MPETLNPSALFSVVKFQLRDRGVLGSRSCALGFGVLCFNTFGFWVSYYSYL